MRGKYIEDGNEISDEINDHHKIFAKNLLLLLM
jgi:hypothetical protein